MGSYTWWIDYFLRHLVCAILCFICRPWRKCPQWLVVIFPPSFLVPSCTSARLALIRGTCLESGLHTHVSWQLRPCLEPSSPPGHWAVSLSSITRNALQFPPPLIPEMIIEFTISPRSENVKPSGYFPGCHLDAFIWMATQWHILDHVWSFFLMPYFYRW